MAELNGPGTKIVERWVRTVQGAQRQRIRNEVGRPSDGVILRGFVGTVKSRRSHSRDFGQLSRFEKCL